MSFATLFTLRRRPLSSLIVLLGLVLFVGACTAPVPTAPTAAATTVPAAATTSAAADLFPLTITDAAGQEFTFDAPPKIGCWWAGCNEILADLGVAAHAGTYTDETAASPFFFPVGTPAFRIEDTRNPEQWAASEADIVIMRVPPSDDLQAVNAAVPIFYLHHPSYGESSQSGYQAFYENLRIVGQLIGQPAAADAAIARFETAMSNLRAIATAGGTVPTVAVLFNGDGYGIIGAGSPFCLALAEVGLGQCVGDLIAPSDYELNAEEFLALNPDWIVYQLGEKSYQERNDPVWSQLAAVKANQVYDAQGHRYYCCSLRGLIHALQEFVHYTQPAANIPEPGFWLDFDPLQSPLVQAPASTASPATAGTRTITHDMGVTAVPLNPQRVLAIDPFVTLPTLLELGVPVVGYGTYSTASEVPAYIDPAQLEGLVFVGNQEPSLEQIALLQPDLIIGSNEFIEAIYPELSQIAPTVGFNLQTALGDWKRTVRDIAAVFGAEKLAVVEAQIADFEARAAAIKEALAAQPAQEVHFVRINPDQFRIHTEVHFAGQVMQEAGVIRPVVDLPATSTGSQIRFGLELLPALNADVLFYMVGGGSIDPAAAQATFDQAANNPLWAQLRAVQKEQLYPIDGDIWLLGGVTAATGILADLESYLLAE
ncbi:MAG: ABC transporter substrate-binding protein [Caldilineaceae bacterium]|nr:ABC transporter substrate-binding protein [Caldilineaceae bacterium]